MKAPSLFGFHNRVVLVVLAIFMSSASFDVCAEQRAGQLMAPSLVAPGLPGIDEQHFFGVLAVRSSKEPITFLILQPQHNELLVGANISSFGSSIPLSLDAGNVNSAEGAGDVAWIGGITHEAVTAASMPVSVGYLAKIDRRTGNLLWEREYGEMETRRSIQSITSLPSGGIVVSGQDSARTWIARISDEGNVVWERFVGVGRDSAVIAQGNTIMLAAVDLCQCNGYYREDLATWSFSDAGELLNHQIIREGLNIYPNQSAARIRIAHAAASIYVLSAWTAFDAQPFGVTSVNAKGGAIWSKTFPETVGHRGRFSGTSFLPAIVLSNGDLLLVGMDRQMAANDFLTRFPLWQLDAANGRVSEVVIRMPPAPPPFCYEQWAAGLSMKEESPGKVLLISLPRSEAKRCGWIGEALVPEFTK